MRNTRHSEETLMETVGQDSLSSQQDLQTMPLWRRGWEGVALGLWHFAFAWPFPRPFFLGLSPSTSTSPAGRFWPWAAFNTCANEKDLRSCYKRCIHNIRCWVKTILQDKPCFVRPPDQDLPHPPWHMKSCSQLASPTQHRVRCSEEAMAASPAQLAYFLETLQLALT